jgi:hypothetical protein
MIMNGDTQIGCVIWLFLYQNNLYPITSTSIISSSDFFVDILPTTKVGGFWL